MYRFHYAQLYACLLFCCASASAIEVSLSDQGLNFTINNDDPLNATIEFDPVSLDVRGTTLVWQDAETTVNLIDSMTVTEPLPDPIPFPHPPLVQHVTNVRQHVTTGRFYTLSFDAYEDALMASGGGGKLDVQSPEVTLFPEELTVTAAALLTAEYEITERVSSFLETETYSLIDGVRTPSQREFSMPVEEETLVSLDAIEMPLQEVWGPDPQIDARNWPDSVALTGGVGARWQSSMLYPIPFRTGRYHQDRFYFLEIPISVTVRSESGVHYLPTPSGLAMLAPGCLLLGYVRRRRRA